MGTRQSFRTTDKVRLEVEATPGAGVLVNQIKNAPDLTRQNSATGGSGWGWLCDSTAADTFTVASPPTRTDLWMIWSLGNGVPNAIYSEDWAHAAGEYAAARLVGAANVSIPTWAKLRFEWLDSTGALIGSSTQTAIAQWTTVTGPGGTGGVTQAISAQLAPAGTVRARLRIDFWGNSAATVNTLGGPVYFKEVTAAKAATSGALTGLGYIANGPTWTNVIGPTHSISVKRSALALGILTAEILDATIDPSQSSLVRPGKRCRLTALNSTTATWDSLFEGKVIRGETTYDPKRTDAKRARVSLTAVDSISQLSQVNRTVQAVGFGGNSPLTYLWKPLEGAGVPYFLQARAAPASFGTYTIPSRSLLDQITIVRDSSLDYAWVDRRGLLQLWPRSAMPTSPLTTLSQSVYSDVSIDYDTDRCINQVTVKIRRINAATGQEVEVTYGPFVNQPSIDQWGPHAQEYVVVGLADTTAAAKAYADSILALNATPAVRINSVQVPIRDATDIVTTKALLDVCDLVTVSNTAAGISQTMRIDGLEHKIDSSEKWTLELTFAAPNSVSAAMPVAAASQPAAAGSTVTATAWTAIPYLAGWADFGGGAHVGQYMIRDGFLYIRGLGKRTGAAAPALTAIFTIPAGLRPIGGWRVFAVVASPTGVGEAGHGVYVDNLGNVSVSTVTMQTNGYVYLDLPPIALD